MRLSRRLIAGTLLGLVVFTLAYFDEAYLGPVKLGVMWKAVVVAGAAWLWVSKARKAISKQFALGSLYAFKSLLYCYGSIGYFLVDLSEAIKFITLPLVTETLDKSKNGPDAASRIRTFLVYFVPLSCLPFLLGLEPLVDKYALDIYGAAGREFSGVFGTKHGAAVTLAAAIILLIHEVRTKAVGRAMGALLLVVCLVSLFMTYVRTGYLALLIGGGVYAVAVYRWRSLIVLVLFGTLVAGAFYELAAKDEVLRMRLTGTNRYNQEYSANQLGSGRLGFWSAAIEGPAQDGVLGIAIGRGLEKTKDYMQRETGLRIFSHNGFLDAYQTNGVIGLIFFVSYWSVLALMVFRRRFGAYGPPAIAIMTQTIVVQLVQGGAFFWFQILLAVCIPMGTNSGSSKSQVGK